MGQVKDGEGGEGASAQKRRGWAAVLSEGGRAGGQQRVPGGRIYTASQRMAEQRELATGPHRPGSGRSDKQAVPCGEERSLVWKGPETGQRSRGAFPLSASSSLPPFPGIHRRRGAEGPVSREEIWCGLGGVEKWGPAGGG